MECLRLAPYKERGTDVNVVLDLMIHDIDLIQSLTGSEIVSIDAIGTPVFSGEIDIANARIRFANGCVANTTASRVSMKTERKLQNLRRCGLHFARLAAENSDADPQARRAATARASCR